MCLLLPCLVAATQDNGFKSIPESRPSYDLAIQVRQWAERAENKVALVRLSNTLVSALMSVIKCDPISKRKREQLFARYYSFITSGDLDSIWHETLSGRCTDESNRLWYQFFVTNNLFSKLLHDLYPVIRTDDDEQSPVILTDDELHALGYVGGWLIRSEVKKIERSKLSRKEDLIETLLSFKENKDDCEKDPDERTVPEWASIINCGGLYICTIEFFDFLCAVETVVKGKMRKGKEEEMKEGFAAQVNKEVLKDDEVLSLWSDLYVDKDLMDVLLERLVKSYVALRGHAFTSQWMEQTKQKQKKSLQKSRSFRSKLQQLSE